MSDVLVVSNVNVMCELVYEVRWDNSTCAPIIDTSLNPPLPTKFIFDMKAPKRNQPCHFLRDIM